MVQQTMGAYFKTQLLKIPSMPKIVYSTAELNLNMLNTA